MNTSAVLIPIFSVSLRTPLAQCGWPAGSSLQSFASPSENKNNKRLMIPDSKDELKIVNKH